MQFLKKAVTILIVGGFFTVSLGQVTFSKMPQKLQLYGRNLTSDSGEVTISGTVKKPSANYQELRLKVFRNNIVKDSVTKTLQFASDSAPFDIRYYIKAEPANYRFEVYGFNGTQTTLLKAADSVVCGDVFIIEGQSNSVAWNLAGTSANSANVNQSPFIRVFGTGCYNGSDSTWYIGQGDGSECSNGNAGQWGLHLARLILDNQKIPVAIFNGGHGGMPIQFFQRKDANPADKSTNYGRLLTRVRGAGLNQSIRAILWHQGENNTDADNNWLSLAGYKSAFESLSADWFADYPNVEKIYVFQIRNGCGHPADSVGRIKEAHRELAQLAKVSVMSTSAQNHYNDNCHYAYNEYKAFADNIYRLVQRDLYGGPNADNINAPNIKFAELNGDGMLITLIMEDIMDSITWATGAEADFKFQGTSAKVSKGVCTGNNVKLTMNSAATGVTAISYLGHQNTPEPMVTNLNGIGALHFYKFPLTTPRYRDSISLANILKSNNITLPIDSFAVFNAGGRIVSLKLGNRKLTMLPKDIGYMDSLKTIDLSANLLKTLPREITKINPTANLMVDLNYMCSVSDTVANWINKYSKDANRKQTQMSDSLHYCNGSVAIIASQNERLELNLFSDIIIHRTSENMLVVQMPSISGIKKVSVFRTNGVRICQATSSSRVITIDMANNPNEIYIVRIDTKGGSIAKRVAAF
jgi:hypothetical protein